MDVIKALVIFVAGGVATATLSLIVARTRAHPDARGWRHLKPGAMHWAGVGIGGGLCLLLVYVRLFVGSTRADADTQMAILTGLIIAFGSLTVATALAARAILRRAVRWRGKTLAYADQSGLAQRSFRDIAQVRSNALGQVVLTFADGAFVRIDPYATGAQELLDLLQEGASSPDGQHSDL